jgi:hypothetical protein
MTETTAFHTAESPGAPVEGAFLLHVWMVDPENADRHIQLLTHLLNTISEQPGFVSARILESAGRSSIAALIETGSVQDRQRFEQLPQVHDVLDQLHAEANLVARPYHDVLALHARSTA